MPAYQSAFGAEKAPKKNILLYTSTLANVIDHLDTSLYIFLAPIIIHDLIHSSLDKGLFTWSLGLTMGGGLRILLALAWNTIHRKIGSARILHSSLFAVSATCLGIGLLGFYSKLYPTSISLWIPILLVFLRAIQSSFSVAESNAARSLAMSTPLSERNLGSILVGLSSIAGTSVAGLLCWSINQWTGSLNHWPWIYLACSALALIIGNWRREFMSDLTHEIGTLSKPQWMPLLMCVLASTFSHSTFHWVSVLMAPYLDSSVNGHLNSQTVIMGMDCLLMALLACFSRRLNVPQIITASAICCVLAGISQGLGIIGIEMTRWIILIAGVAAAACYSSWLQLVTQPHQLFPYSCLSGAIGNTIASFALSASFYMNEHSAGLWWHTAPFLLIFGLQAAASMLWNRYHRAPSPM